jgi:hypothetical protein
VVRVAACTGREVGDNGVPLDVGELVGAELVVEEAVPTVERDGWLIGIRGFEETDGWTIWFAEDSLESTGLAEDWGDPPTDTWEWVSIGEENPQAEEWRDTIWIDLITDWTLEGEDATPEEDRRAEAALDSAAAALAKLVPTRDEIGGTWVEDADEPVEISLWLEPAGDALEAYERIVSEPSRAWLHGENDRGFPESTWEIPQIEPLVFLVPGIREARVRLEYYSSPERFTPRTA